MEQFIYYAPERVVVLVILIHERIVVTPEQLEKKHREIIKDVEKRYATLNSLEDLKEQFCDMKDKIDKIYDCLM